MHLKNLQESLSDNKKAQYESNGFHIESEKIIPEAVLSSAMAGIKRVASGEYNTGLAPWGKIGNSEQLQRTAQIHLADQDIFNLVTQPAIGKVAAQITGANEIKVWGTQLYSKPPQLDTQANVGWHTDYQHMPFFRDGVITAWLPLIDVNENSGAITYIRGSHQWQNAAPYLNAAIQDLGSVKSHFIRANKAYSWCEVTATMAAGGICFHHKDMIHGSSANQTPVYRHAIAIGLLTGQAEIDTKANDYGYRAVLDNRDFCPVIYSQ
ncbi:phytanoyl-CoA dioxygenase family protein [Thalassomonas actiniarum]|uniref:Phytanoyl-CoA dioxygenase family protein n=1 Tax=Thalassomonas actiniarum TaxID=485447 RepID=A0AAE9YUR2_9GAMM|nr:phytanoyl-CoA dioxygenase family protein [Thalassomonas actiniarum]WDE01601.1 phytanoyl-CoA dioxygenase family protein [Thalassomonas actiniarum]